MVAAPPSDAVVSPPAILGVCVCVCVRVFYNQDALNISSNGDNQMWAYELSACTVGNCF